MRLAPEGTSVSLGGSIDFMGQDLLQLSERAMRDLRGRRIAMVFQDPMTSLNPVMTIGSQIDDIVRRHTGSPGKAVRRRTRGVAGSCRHSQPATSRGRLSAPVLRRNAAARADCDRHLLRSGSPDRRRAHHRPRRHRAGADSAIAHAAAGRTRDVPHADHARFRGRCRNGRAGECHVSGRDRRRPAPSSVSLRSRAHEYTRALAERRSAPRQGRSRIMTAVQKASARRPAPLLEVRDLSVVFPAQRGNPPLDRREAEYRSISRPARRLGLSASPDRERRRPAAQFFSFRKCITAR